MSELPDGLTAEELAITNISQWHEIVINLRKEYKEFQITSKEFETQLEQMLDDTQEEAERAQRDLNLTKEDNDKLTKANEKLLNEYKKLKEKYNTEVLETEQESAKIKEKYKDMNERLVTLEIDNEDLERRNQAFESAIENCEEKIDSLLEELALTQSERDDIEACLSEQIEKLNQQLEELKDLYQRTAMESPKSKDLNVRKNSADWLSSNASPRKNDLTKPEIEIKKPSTPEKADDKVDESTIAEHKAEPSKPEKTETEFNEQDTIDRQAANPFTLALETPKSDKPSQEKSAPQPETVRQTPEESSDKKLERGKLVKTLRSLTISSLLAGFTKPASLQLNFFKFQV